MGVGKETKERDMDTSSRPLRSFLFAPGNHARRVEKALSLDADAVILDLEDAVMIGEDLRPARWRLPNVPAWAALCPGARRRKFCYGDR